MKKLLILGFLTIFSTSKAQAGLISMVTGADMAGLLVTVTFGNGDTQSDVWESTGPESGGVGNRVWSLTQEGDTIGPIASSTFSGAWTLTTIRSIESILIEGINIGLVFDTVFGDGSGTSSGHAFTYDTALATVTTTYTEHYQDELFYSMLLTGSNPNYLGRGSSMLLGSGSFDFMIDVDIIEPELATTEVTAPTTISILALTILGLIATSRRKTK
ncbi:MAG: hypothetical protein ABJH06_17535 [Paraglaciecola sp.]|uniref:hypothetical protein n=1 Tax=Paraglaciecola sp. TaxID=1920173 RepID=UPI0032999B89